MRFIGRSRKGFLTRFGLVLVVICCLAGKGCEGKSEADSSKVAIADNTNGKVVAEEFADEEAKCNNCTLQSGVSASDSSTTKTSTSISQSTEAPAHVHTWIYSSYDSVVAQQNVQVCWDCGTHYAESKCPNCGSSSYYATVDTMYSEVQERQCSSCGAYEYLGEK